MNTIILVCNFLIPIIMISTGLLYKNQLYLKGNKLLDLFIPIALLGSGLSFNNEKYDIKNSDSIKSYSLIWIISGIFTLILTIIGLVINISDFSRISVTLFELELLIIIAVFIIAKFTIKHKK